MPKEVKGNVVWRKVKSVWGTAWVSNKGHRIEFSGQLDLEKLAKNKRVVDRRIKHPAWEEEFWKTYEVPPGLAWHVHEKLKYLVFPKENKKLIITFEKEPSSIHEAKFYEANFDERGYSNHIRINNEEVINKAKQHLQELKENLEGGVIERRGGQNRKKLESEFAILTSVFQFFFKKWLG